MAQDTVRDLSEALASSVDEFHKTHRDLTVMQILAAIEFLRESITEAWLGNDKRT